MPLRCPSASRLRLSVCAVPVAAASTLLLLLQLAGCGHASPAASVPPPAAAPRAPAPPAPVAYNADIQPIFAENCFLCHGPDSSTRKASLRLDRFADATSARGDHDAAIVPGHPEKSPLVERITATDVDERMPPVDSHKTLKPAEIDRLKRWIAEGAVYQPHWSFLPPVAAAVPAAGEGWARNPIDRFIAARLAAEGLAPARAEDPARLLRRASLDLTGLPPSPAELAEFQRDPSPAAYERAVDRMLASDASAEHLARYWLDAVRYADTHGIHIDYFRKIWPYRDWVVDAYRRNLPFDQFTVEQMAGDMLPNATLEQRVASGYNRCLPTTNEGGVIPAEYEAIYAKDRIETTATVWLGLTAGCAACHDHKFDPLTMRDFYGLAAIFRNNTMPVMDGNVTDPPPTLLVPAEPDRARWEKLEKEIAQAAADLKFRANTSCDDFETWLAGRPVLPPPPSDFRERWRLRLDEAAGPLTLPGGRVAAAPAPERIDGPYGPAPALNGLDIVLAGAEPLRRDCKMSFSCWVRVEGKPSGTLLSSLSEADPDRGWELYLEDGKIGFFFSEEKDGFTSRNVTGFELAPDVWHQLVLMIDGPSDHYRFIDLHVDGFYAMGVDRRGFDKGVLTDAPLRLGSRHSASGQPANPLRNGRVWMQDLRLHDRAFEYADIGEWAHQVGAHRALRQAPPERSGPDVESLRAAYLVGSDPKSTELARRLDQLNAEAQGIRRRGRLTLVMEEKKDSEPVANILIRGEYANLGPEVKGGTPSALPSLPAGVRPDRLALARWLVAPENPLTARVTVNRAWQQFFGTGLVETSNDFGVTGARPSHPELLDWLAVDFRDHGWDYRRLLRQIATSATYRQSAATTAALLERDPGNRLLARGPRHRLDAEVLRDQVLAASGLLARQLGGEPVRPYQPPGIWEDVTMPQSNTRLYGPGDTGDKLYRRSLYTIWKRTAPPPAMDILNAPPREVSCVRRDRTNTPLQAFVTMNEPLFVEASRQLAARAMADARDFDGRLDAIALRLVGRRFTAPERRILRGTYEEALAHYRRDPADATAFTTVGESRNPGLPAPDLAAWTLVASQVMNLDESLTK